LRLSLEADQSQQIQAISLAAEILWIQGHRTVEELDILMGILDRDMMRCVVHSWLEMKI